MTDRERALALVRRIEREQLYASLVLAHETPLVRTIVLGILRWRSRLDFVIETFAQRPVSKLDSLVLSILRLGVYQIAYMNVPAHAAVGETVSLAPKRGRGLVNAVLRRVASGPIPEPKDLARQTAHPQWLIDRWTKSYGAERAAAIARANQELSYPDVLSLGETAPPEAQRSELVDGLWRLHGSSAALDRADFYPMDEGSAVIAAMARACGDDVLDLAAAPGGKTIFMQKHGAKVVSNDVSLARLRPLIGRQKRLVVSDGRRAPFRERFRVVLLDAPCSATGTIRKSPEIKWRLREIDLRTFAELQRELLASAIELASDYVVYSTCSLEPEENDEVVAGYERVDAAPFVPPGARSWVKDGVLRLTPESGADGFTAFVLRPVAR